MFVAGLEEELLPHALALMDGEDEDDGVEEERRLLYVGMTRAKEELFLTHAQTRLHFGASSWRVPSRFSTSSRPSWWRAARRRCRRRAGRVRGPGQRGELKVGDRSEHDHFGYGMVARLQGSGINARVTVEFQAVGNKVLLVQYANLRVIHA